MSSESATSLDGLVVRSSEPLNLEMPFSRLESFITPNEQFYVRCHFPIPDLDRGTWRLRVEGSVADRFEVRYRDLLEMETHTITATMECAGNGRALLEPKVKGVQWERGAVGNATWTGVLLRDLLQRAGVKSEAIEVILEGADRGAVKEPPRPEGEIQYARGLPLKKAMEDVLLAWQMNGEELTPAHGFPLRAIVPGWFGMAAVKWLQRIVVTDQPFHGYYQSADYFYWERREGLPTLVPLSEMQVKAEIARPEAGENVAAGSRYLVRGAAWAANVDVAMVEISSDRGVTWSSARLLGEPVKNAWRFWEFAWEAPRAPGPYTLMARATDAAGRMQPLSRNRDYGTYIVDHCLPTEVHISQV
jgi:DMSO/TMAO reductase YedYZ molybdopterin-dependent catalytic subunit